MVNLLVQCSPMTPPSIFTLQIPESVNYGWKIEKGKLELDGCGDIVTLDSNFPPSPGQNKLILRKSEGKWSQEWVAISRDVVLMQDDGRETQEWTTQFVDPPYQYGLLPQQSFPGVVRGGCLSSALDREVSKTAMHYCDKSMSLLLGSTTSLGSLRAIKDEVISKSLDYLPGRCCFDKPTTQNSYFGVYVSSEMKLLY